jgi:hypothetical protein
MNNKSKLKWAVWLPIVCGYLAGGALVQAAGVPPFINYQGVLANAQGHPFTNQNVTVNFRIYDAPKGGTMIWGTRQLVTTDSNGVFNASLGDEGESVPGASNQVSSILYVFSGTNADSRWLEIEVEYNRSYAMSPRQRFLTSPYAYQAGNAAGSRGDFVVGDVLTVKSNAVFQQGVHISDAGQEALVFNNSMTDSSSLTVSQKLAVAGAMTVNGNLNVQGNVIFSNDVAFTESVEFDGPALFNKGVSFRGNTTAFGSFRLLASHSGEHSDSGTVPTNGFLGIRIVISDNDDHNFATLTLDNQQYEFHGQWNTGGSDYLHFKGWTLFPARAGASWNMYAEGSKISYDVYFFSIP